MVRVFLMVWFSGCATAAVPAKTELAEPVEELGDVAWTRGIDAAQSRATAERHVLVLFDEVPGCSTVKGFGKGALTHPLLVEAVETLFEPVVVYNNTPEDTQVMASFGEPRWNNPVMRVLDAKGKTLERFEGPYSESGLASFLVSTHPAPPAWLQDLAADMSAARQVETATYEMACFWTGEAHLSKAEGVVGARTGWQNGREVVEVSYDPERLSSSSLDAHAKQAGFRTAKRGTLSATPQDDRHALRRTPFKSVPMTAAQATRANAIVASGGDPSSIFSPRQLGHVGGSTGNLGHGEIRDAFKKAGS